MKNKKQLIGIALLAVLIIIIILIKIFSTNSNNGGGIFDKNLTTVYVATGGGKEDFIQDEDVNRIMRDKYGLDIVYDSWSNGKLIKNELVRQDGKTKYDAMFCSDQRFYDYFKLPANTENGEAKRDNVLNGGLASQISMFLATNNYSGVAKFIGFNDKFIEQGTISELFNQENITEEYLKKIVTKLKKI